MSSRISVGRVARKGLVAGAVAATLATVGVMAVSASASETNGPSAKPEGCVTNYYTVTRDGARLFYYRVSDAAMLEEGYTKNEGDRVTGPNGQRNEHWTHVYTSHGDGRVHYMVSSSLDYVGCS